MTEGVTGVEEPMRQFLYKWPILAYAVSALILAAIVYFLYRTKKPWLYYFAVLLTASALLVMNLTGAQI